MRDSVNLKVFSWLFSGFVFFHAVLLFYVGIPILFVFAVAAALILAVNGAVISKKNYSASAHLLNIVLVIYTAVICYTTGGIYSIAIFLLFLSPVFSSLLTARWQGNLYIGVAVVIFISLILAQNGFFKGLSSNFLVNIGIYRISNLSGLFLLFGGCIWALCHNAKHQTALMEASKEESQRIFRDASEALKIKDQFLANMSHEIRNPMNGIIGMMHVLLDTDLDEEQKKYSQIVYNSARALLSIVNDVLDLSKIEAGKLELDVRNFDLEIALQDIVSLPELQARQKGIDFSYSIASDVPCLLKGDIGRIRQILNNLTGNAIKFTDAGEVVLTVSLESEAEETATLHFNIEDTGIGISDEQIEKLFQSFTQADSSITKRYGGTGLGLAISKLLVEKMGGKIGVDSIEMIGSTFWFTLALPKQDEKERAVDLFSCNVDHCKVLVMTDGSSLGQNFENNLEALNIQYEQAFDETEAFEMLKWAVDEGEGFDLVILEAKETDAPAQILGRKIQEDEVLRQTKRVLLTSVGKKGDAKKFEELGFSAFLSKPVEKELLLDAVKAVSSLPSPVEQPGQHIITKYSIIENKKRLKHILIVEDMETNLITAKALIGKLGYRTDEARNGEQAVEKVKERGFDLVLMDCQMPVMDGFEATRQIRKFEEENSIEPIPIVAMTGNAFEKDRQMCFDVGMNDFIAKPVEPGILSEKIRKNILISMAIRNEAQDDAPEKQIIEQEDFSKTSSTDLPAEESPAPASLESLPVFDKEKLFERFGRDQELVEMVMESFFQEAPELLENMAKAIETDEVEAVRTNAHALKGSSANVNAERLRQAAFDLETAAKKSQTDKFTPIFKCIEEEYQTFSRKARV